jgi:parallel beta-helix repeat protein
MPLFLPRDFSAKTVVCQNKKTLYVGGSGDKNYSGIQSAIDAASSGDTIFVFSGTYYEAVIVNKSVNLIGENKDNTILEGNCSRDIITIIADDVNITGFTIQNGHFGIIIQNSSGHSIIKNNFINSLHGISIRNNSGYIKISKNIFDYNQYSIRLYSSSSVEVSFNNFYSYKLHAFFVGTRLIHSKNRWKNNYWGESRLLPYPVFGKIRWGFFSFRLVNLDLRPARKSNEF